MKAHYPCALDKESIMEAAKYFNLNTFQLVAMAESSNNCILFYSSFI